MGRTAAVVPSARVGGGGCGVAGRRGAGADLGAGDRVGWADQPGRLAAARPNRKRVFSTSFCRRGRGGVPPQLGCAPPDSMYVQHIHTTAHASWGDARRRTHHSAAGGDPHSTRCDQPFCLPTLGSGGGRRGPTSHRRIAPATEARGITLTPPVSPRPPTRDLPTRSRTLTMPPSSAVTSPSPSPNPPQKSIEPPKRRQPRQWLSAAPPRRHHINRHDPPPPRLRPCPSSIPPPHPRRRRPQKPRHRRHPQRQRPNHPPPQRQVPPQPPRAPPQPAWRPDPGVAATMGGP